MSKKYEYRDIIFKDVELTVKFQFIKGEDRIYSPLEEAYCGSADKAIIEEVITASGDDVYNLIEGDINIIEEMVLRND